MMAIDHMKIVVPALKGPDSSNTVPAREALADYINREFPLLTNQSGGSYTIPATFIPKQGGEPQAEAAEQKVFDLLKEANIPGIIFHGREYIGDWKSKGIVAFAEHDFVILTSDKFVVIEVKSNADDLNQDGVQIVNSGKSNADKRREGKNQIKKLISFMQQKYDLQDKGCGKFIMWPFLGGERWKDDAKEGFIHVFRENFPPMSSNFTTWFKEQLRAVPELQPGIWKGILHHFLLLSCGSTLTAIQDQMDSLNKKELLLLSQDQAAIINATPTTKEPIFIHGPAGSGKTLLILIKIDQLCRQGLIDKENKAAIVLSLSSELCVYIKRFLEKHACENVDVFTYSHKRDLPVGKKYKHVFVDSGEELTEYTPLLELEKIRQGNTEGQYGIFWIMVDLSQSPSDHADNTEFLSKLQNPDYKLTKCYRSTGIIMSIVSELYKKRNMRSAISTGHNIQGVPIYWYSRKDTHTRTWEEAVCTVLLDLCGTHGIKANDIWVISTDDNHLFFSREHLKIGIQKTFTGSHVIHSQPSISLNVVNSKENEFTVCGTVGKLKGLETKVIVYIPGTNHPWSELSNDTNAYISLSRATCMVLYLVDDESEVPQCAEKVKFEVKTRINQESIKIFQELEQGRDAKLTCMKDAAKRYETFENFPNIENSMKRQLAEAGFFHSPGILDQPPNYPIFFCSYCLGLIVIYEGMYSPKKEHERACPNCPFVRNNFEGLGNIPFDYGSARLYTLRASQHAFLATCCLLQASRYTLRAVCFALRASGFALLALMRLHENAWI